MLNKSPQYFLKMPEKINYSAYMAIKPHFDMLARLGYCKVIKKDLSPLKRRLHKCYRIVVWLFVFVYNLQHILRIIEVRKDILNISKHKTQLLHYYRNSLPSLSLVGYLEYPVRKALSK